MERQSWDIISFGGEETLCLAKFAKNVIDDSSLYTPYIVHIKGRYVINNSEASVLGKLKILNSSDEYINGYIRNIRVEDIYSKKRKKGLSVGCSNATLEDIAADKVTFFFFGKTGKRHTLIRDRHYICYAVRPLKKYTKKNMNELDNSGEYLKAIAVAKRLGSDEEKESRHKAKDLLIRYLELEDPDFDADMKEMAAEAFRSLEELCKENPKCSEQTTNALIGYIERNITIPGYRNSVIYAIEALGFVANHNEDQKVKVFKYLPELLSSCQREDFKDDPAIYWHILWASLVTLTRTMPNTLTKTMHDNPVTLPISAINKSLLDESVLAEIEPEEARRFISPIIKINKSLLDKNVLAEIKPKEARSVIQKVMAEVIISSGIISLEVYLSLFGLDRDDLNNMRIAGEQDRVRETKKLGDNSKNLIELVIPKLRAEAGNLTRAMATAILIGVVKSCLGVP